MIPETRCPRCQHEPVAGLLIHGTYPTTTEYATVSQQAHPLCAACLEDVHWFVVHRTVKRPELLEQGAIA